MIVLHSESSLVDRLSRQPLCHPTEMRGSPGPCPTAVCVWRRFPSLPLPCSPIHSFLILDRCTAGDLCHSDLPPKRALQDGRGGEIAPRLREIERDRDRTTSNEIAPVRTACRDRTEIAPRSHRDRTEIAPRDRTEIAPRSHRDRTEIRSASTS